jgi:putative signal transducing protein
MQKVFVAQHHAEAHLVNGLLRSHGIDSEVRGEVLFTTVEAASMIPGASPEVWVLNSHQVPQAMDLIQRYSKGEALPGFSGQPWQCPKCGEAL